MNADRAEAAFWAGFLRNRNVDLATAEDGAIPVAGGYAICAVGTYFRLAFAAGSTRPLNAEDLSVLAEFYGRRNLPVRLELSEEALERDRALLTAAGLESEATVVRYEAESLTDSSVPANVTVHQVTDRRRWVTLVSRAFAEGSEPDESGVRTNQMSAVAAHGLFIAEVDGVSAGAGAVAVAGEYAFLYTGAVLPEFRGRGVHRALLLARAAFGTKRGASRCAIQVRAGSDAERSVKATGFERTAVLRRVLLGNARVMEG